MRISAIAILFALLGTGMAYPQYEASESEGWKTWGAVKSFFRPVTNWFSNELPHQSPQDLYEDAHESAVNVKNWAENNAVIQSIGEAVKPVQDWVQDGVEYVKDKPLRILYGDVKGAVNDMDESVGSWLDENIG